MTDATRNPSGLTPELDWLIRLRWAAVAGIGSLSLLAALYFSIQLPWTLIVVCLFLVAGSNLWAWRGHFLKSWLPACLILGDIVIFTVLLYHTGGAHNPFTVLYLLNMTLAVMLIDGRLAWFAVGLCTGCFALLFRSPHMLMASDGTVLCSDLDFHLQGMLLATLLTGAGVVYFISRLNADLRVQRDQANRAREAADREHRFASLVTMAAGVAHELATPLGTIAVASRELEMTTETVCGNAECRDDVKLIRREVDRCRDILDQMGRRSLNPEVDAPAELRPSVVQERLSGYLSPDHARRLRWEIDDAVHRFRTRPDALLRSLAILVKNAFEASAPDAKVAIQMGSEGKTVVFRVCDTGSGMSPKVRERLGEPFFTTKEAGMGIGLGFFLARALIEKIGGRISVDSELGKGTKVTVSLPMEPHKVDATVTESGGGD